MDLVRELFRNRGSRTDVYFADSNNVFAPTKSLAATGTQIDPAINSKCVDNYRDCQKVREQRKLIVCFAHCVAEDMRFSNRSTHSPDLLIQ